MVPNESNPIVLYDGFCGLCNGLNQFLLKRDAKDRFRFASLQSNFSNVVLKRHGANSADLDTVYVVLNHDQRGERLLSRSDAILYLAGQLGGIWRLSTVGRFIPKVLRDAMYKLVASNRYRLFGKHESCIMPDPRHRDKFLEV
ncbi:MAG TPA: DCC1-like thiol-disulfide oxidoreductase family protein [Pyrinomonadaceae bacterium]|nr:DCC1-like thiol-disulfide oxidoreductase family protein [Pyrinomonadaceae bacterium]